MRAPDKTPQENKNSMFLHGEIRKERNTVPQYGDIMPLKNVLGAFTLKKY